MTENEKQEHWDRIKTMYLGYINRLEIALGYTPSEDLDGLTIGDLAVIMNHAAVRIERLHAQQAEELEAEQEWDGVGIHPTHKTYISDSSLYDWKCERCHRTDITGSGWGQLNEPCPEAKPWEFPGAKPRYNSMGNANYPEYECGCPQHHCDGC